MENIIDLNVEFGEPVHNVCIPMKIGNNNRMLHIIVNNDGSYKIQKYTIGDRIRFSQMPVSINTGTIVGYDVGKMNRYVVKTDHNEFIEISEGNISSHII